MCGERVDAARRAPPCRFCGRSVGLVQRVLEAKGFPTVALSMIPDLTRAVGVPRLAGISYPMGRPLGRPHDPDGQRAVLRAMLDLLSAAQGPDSYVELPFVWPGAPARARKRGEGSPAAADRRPSNQEAMAGRQPLHRPDSARGTGRLTRQVI